MTATILNRHGWQIDHEPRIRSTGAIATANAPADAVEWLTVDQAAERIGVTPETIRRCAQLPPGDPRRIPVAAGRSRAIDVDRANPHIRSIYLPTHRTHGMPREKFDRLNRLARLIAKRPGMRRSEIAQRFGLGVRQIQDDLQTIIDYAEVTVRTRARGALVRRQGYRWAREDEEVRVEIRWP